MVVSVLCSSHLKGTSNGKPTSTMFTNCERHFRKTLEILGPTLVVIQGIKVWKSSQDVLKPIRSLSKNLHQCDLAGRRVIVAAFTHPSARGPNRWNSPKSPYFREVVRPNLETALASLVTE